MISQHRQFVKTHHPNLDPRLFYSCVVMRMLYDMAIDGYERHGSTGTGNNSAAGIANNTQVFFMSSGGRYFEFIFWYDILG